MLGQRNLSQIMLGLLVTVSVTLAQDVVQPVGPNSSVNFSKRTVSATGIGLPGGMGGQPGMIRAARLDALRNLLEAIQGIALTSSTTIENGMQKSDIIKTRVEGIANNFRTIGVERSNPDGSVEVTIEMSMDGPFLEAVLPESMGGGQPLALATKGVVYTGLIIDATGLEAWPALAPRILNENNQEVYGSEFVSRDWAIKNGLVGYEKELSVALKNDRVGKNPLVARGLKAVGDRHTDIVISNQDAQTLHSLKENLSFLNQCRVIIVLN